MIQLIFQMKTQQQKHQIWLENCLKFKVSKECSSVLIISQQVKGKNRTGMNLNHLFLTQFKIILSQESQFYETLILRSNDQGFEPNDSQTVKLIKQILWSRVRPTVQDDGGDVKYISFDQNTGILKIAMLGSCAGCPSSSATLKNGIFKMMKHYVGEVKDVIAEDFKPK